MKNVITNFYKTIKIFSSIKKMEDIYETDELCLICLSDIDQGKKLQCGHAFHESCLRSWIQVIM